MTVCKQPSLDWLVQGWPPAGRKAVGLSKALPLEILSKFNPSFDTFRTIVRQLLKNDSTGDFHSVFKMKGSVRMRRIVLN